MPVVKLAYRPVLIYTLQWTGSNLPEVQDFLDTWSTEGHTATEDEGILTVSGDPSNPYASGPVGSWMSAGSVQPLMYIDPEGSWDTSTHEDVSALGDGPYSFGITSETSES